MNPRPIAVEPTGDRELLITFQNGEKRIFDMKPMLELPLYKPLEDPALFARAHADGMCVYWNDDIDLCPDRAYLESRPL